MNYCPYSGLNLQWDMEDIHCLAMYKLLLHHHMKPPKKSICGIYVFLTSCHLDNKKLLWEKLLWGRSIWWQWQILAHGDFSWGGKHLSSLWEVLRRSAQCQNKHPSVPPCLSEQPRVQPGYAAVHGTLGAQGGQGPAAAAEQSPGRVSTLWEGAQPWCPLSRSHVLCTHQEGGDDPGRAAT